MGLLKGLARASGLPKESGCVCAHVCMLCLWTEVSETVVNFMTSAPQHICFSIEV